MSEQGAPTSADETDGGPYFVSSEAVEQIADWKEMIAAVQAAYAQPITRLMAPPRAIAKADRAMLRAMSAIPPGGRYFGAKLMGISMGAASPGVEYVIVLFDKKLSRIGAFVDATLVTAYRTAATSAAGVDRLAPAGPAHLGVLGSGLEAAMHTRAIAAVRPLESVTVFSPTPARREAFAAAVFKDLGVPCKTVDSAEAVTKEATIVVAAARSRGEQPILYGHWLRPGMTIVSIGSTVPEQREIDVSVVERSDLIVCDDVEEVSHETGDMIEATKAGIAFVDKTFSLNQLMSGELDPQRAAAAISMFKSVGGGLQDVVVAELLLEKAIAAGVATPLPIRFRNKTP